MKRRISLSVAVLASLVLLFFLLRPRTDLGTVLSEEALAPAPRAEIWELSKAPSHQTHTERSTTSDTVPPRKGKIEPRERISPDAPPPTSHEMMDVQDGERDAALPDHHEFSADREGILGAMKHKLPEFRECYEGWLQLVPNLEGTIRLGLTIEASAADPSTGEVIEVSVLEGDTNHAVFEGCLLNTVSELKFYDLPDRGRMEVTYPLSFRSTPQP